MATDDKDLVHAYDLNLKLMQEGRNVVDFTRSKYTQEFAQMMVIDYLTANTDRHMWNWDFFRDSNTGKLLGLHDLYDHNNCFDAEAMAKENLPSLVEEGKSMRKVAEFYVKRSGLKLIEKPTKNMFVNKSCYNMFITRCKQLNLM